MTSKWVDFKTVRGRLDFAEVLSHYGIEQKGRGKQVKIICPFHDDHKTRKIETRTQLAIGLTPARLWM